CFRQGQDSSFSSGDRLMRVENHRLVDAPGLVDAELSARNAPNRVNLLTPRMIVIHYDVCHDMEMNTRAQFASGLYYHVAAFGKDGDARGPEVRQYTPFNRQGSHAKGFNDRAIGLVLVNP